VSKTVSGKLDLMTVIIIINILVLLPLHLTCHKLLTLAMFVLLPLHLTCHKLLTLTMFVLLPLHLTCHKLLTLTVLPVSTAYGKLNVMAVIQTVSVKNSFWQVRFNDSNNHYQHIMVI
jgi:hypothetical protein